MTSLAIFPLGAVLFPAMPTALRIFEERYVVMLSRVLQRDPAEFGVVLIERGSEVGGGDHRFPIGTVARITQWQATQGLIGLLALGDQRFEVTEWLHEDPHPQAMVREVPRLQWSEELQPLRAQAEQVVRRTLARASELGDQRWSAGVSLDQDPVQAAWQLAGIAPLGPLDQVRLLRSTSTEELLRGIIELTTAAAETLTLSWPEDLDGLGDLSGGDGGR
ncbi:LON peptidase substrate-binding domain-containing protein [soil metagenome]